MRLPRLLSPVFCLVAALLLVPGALYRQGRPYSPAVSGGPWISGCDLPIDLTAWIPPREALQLRDFPPRRLDSSEDDETGDTSVRPAWGILLGMVVLFLYLWGSSLDVTFTIYVCPLSE
jgi:hypothetical protein